MTPGEIADLMVRMPREAGEDLTDWFERVLAKGHEEARRLPYREPGEDDE